MYEQTRAENPNEIGPRNVNQMKGRYKRLSENASKWVSAYQIAYNNKTSGMSLKDVEINAHKIYEGDGTKFLDLIVYNEVMCKYPKWQVNLKGDNRRSHPENDDINEESGGSTKRSSTKNGIYPSWVAFVKSITSPQIRKHKLFAQRQEAARKDVERAFGVIQARFAFLRHPCLIWDQEQMGQVMIVCIILHNMIVEDGRDTYRNYDRAEFFHDIHARGTDDDEYSTERIADLSRYMSNRALLRNREAHASLKNDLIEHIWQKFGDGN